MKVTVYDGVIAQVFLDDVEVSNCCVEADTERGYVDKWHEPKIGWPKMQIHRVFGNVRIENMRPRE